MTENKTQPLLAFRIKKIKRVSLRQRVVEMQMSWMAWDNGVPLVHREVMQFGENDIFDFKLPEPVYFNLIRIIKDANILSEDKNNMSKMQQSKDVAEIILLEKYTKIIESLENFIKECHYMECHELAEELQKIVDEVKP